MSGTHGTPLGTAFGLSDEALALASDVFAMSTRKLGVDGEKIFQSFAETGSFKEALGVSDAVIEGLYGRAHQQFLIGKYDRAEDVFRSLCALDGSRLDFWLGLGICCRIRGEDKTALAAFETAATLDPTHAIPHFHRLEIFITTEDWPAAEQACDLFEERATGDEPDHIMKSFKTFKTALDMRRTG